MTHPVCRPTSIVVLILVVLSGESSTLADPVPEPPRPTIGVEWSGADRRQLTVNVSGLDDATLEALERKPGTGHALLSVYTLERSNAPADETSPLFGTYRVDRKARSLRFQARFPLEPGVHYRAVLHMQGPKAVAQVVDFMPDATPEPSGPATVVARVAPARDVLPENLLKFYLEFSAPMSRGEAYEHLRLLDGSGKPLDLPFLELGEELWDPRGVRFTLLFDPGRIKTGLKPREELGPVLRAGRTYTLVVDRGWRDATGRPLGADFRKVFKVGPPDVTPPDPKTWTITPPAPGSRRPLVVRFSEPLDRAMLARVLAVAGVDGRILSGQIAVGADETSWSFTPERPWSPGTYALLAGRSLEDQAGNSIERRFEVDQFDRVDTGDEAQSVVVRLPFDVPEP